MDRYIDGANGDKQVDKQMERMVIYRQMDGANGDIQIDGANGDIQIDRWSEW